MRTLPDFDELNTIRLTLGEEIFAMVREDGKPNRKRCEDIIFDLLTMGYVYGIEVAGLDLETDIPVDNARMREVAMLPTAGETFAQRLDNHITEFEQSTEDVVMATDKLVNALSVLAETETHRTINQGIMDGAEWYEAETGNTVYKQWVTMRDDRVRDTHDYLEGATVPLNARFYTYDGDSARFPGDFAFPENVINCRCTLKLIV